MVTAKVAELRDMLSADEPAEWVSQMWTNYNNQRAETLERWAEVNSYVTATDTRKTANSHLPWTHHSPMPKLTQIRDNLHANYISSLFPNDKWLMWDAYSPDSAHKEKADTVRFYMENKTREGGFRNTVSQLLIDYIDEGNAFAMPSFETRYKEVDNEKTPAFIGPKCVRINPYDIVFNPLASDFAQTFKIIRSVHTIGELAKMAQDDPDYGFFQDVVDRRRDILNNTSKFSHDDWNKAQQYNIDGFGNLEEYYQSNSVEILDFYGDYYDKHTGELQRNKLITIVDRSYLARSVDIPTYGGEAPIRHVGWRKRQDNQWAMGPLENLIGLQYLLDHYLNMGANALDLKVIPPKKIIGEVEEFVWAPNEEIHIDENGDVQEMAQEFTSIYTVRDWMEYIEGKMELYAGAPREAMGMRTPGEKTAHEVQALENAAARIFQEKIIQFELFLEEVLNDMLEISHRHLDKSDMIRIMDPDTGAAVFKKITKADLTADGIIRPVGARHFAQKAQELQNLMGIFNSPMGELITPHTSTIALSQFVKDVVDLRGYDMFKTNIAVQEQQQLQSLMGQAEQDTQELQAIEEELPE